jgi:hypothetical protein
VDLLIYWTCLALDREHLVAVRAFIMIGGVFSQAAAAIVGAGFDMGEGERDDGVLTFVGGLVIFEVALERRVLVLELVLDGLGLVLVATFGAVDHRVTLVW